MTVNARIPEAVSVKEPSTRSYINRLIQSLRSLVNQINQNLDNRETFTTTELTKTLDKFDTEFIDTAGTLDLDQSHSVHLVSSFGGDLTLNLPEASTATRVYMIIKKTDSSSNKVIIKEVNGNGPDQGTQELVAQYEGIAVLSDGNQWFIVGSF